MIVIAFSGCSRANPEKDFARARDLFWRGELILAQKETERGYERYANDNPKWAWKFRVLHARVLNWRGKNPEAFALLKPDLPPSLKSTDLDIQKKQLEILLSTRTNGLDSSRAALVELRQLCETTGCGVLGEILIAQGLVEMQNEKYERAQDFFNEGLRVARQRADAFLEASALVNLSHAAVQREHYDEAIDLAIQARQIAESIQAQLLVANAQGNLGWARYKTGDFEGAKSLLVPAAAQAERLGRGVGVIRWLNASGTISLSENHLDEASEAFRKAWHLANASGSDKEDILDAEISIALVSIRAGDLTVAKQYTDHAINQARTDGLKSDELYALLAKAQIAAYEHEFTQAESLLRQITVEADPEVDPSLRWEALHELAVLYEDNRRPSDASNAYLTGLGELECARDSVQHEEARLPFLANGSGLYDDYVHFLVGEGKTTEALQVADYSRAQMLSEGLGRLNKPAACGGKAHSLRPVSFIVEHASRAQGATTLYYWLGSRESYLWAITPKRTDFFKLPKKSEIDEAVQNYARALTGPRDPLETGNPDGQKLYEMLIAPAQKSISSDSRVLVIGDGSLAKLNFETLIVPGEKPHYWIDDVTVANATALRLVDNSRKVSSAKGAKLLMIGAPVSPNADYPELRNAETEIQRIQAHFDSGQREIFAGDKATASAYFAAHPDQFSYIHFVAHGTASRLSPLDSAVVLSKEGGQDDAFKLYAREIIKHRLNADLVTVSACYGSGSRAYTGEGLVGLSWAFLRAGAHHVIGALWEVNDESTPQLMDQMYGELRNGKSPAAALRAAKLSMLHSSGRYSKASYWAPFQLYLGS